MSKPFDLAVPVSLGARAGISEVWAAFLEARPVVQLVFAMRFAVGGALSSDAAAFLPLHAAAGQCAWLASMWFVYLVNGMSDLEGDRLNASSRPIAAGVLRVERARVISAVLAAFSILVGSVVDLKFSLFCASMLMLGVVYSYGPFALKKWSPTASITVATAGFVTYVAGAYAFSGAVTSSTVLVAGIMGAWMAAAGNYKDLGEEVGDRAAGRRTLPVLLGRRRATFVIWMACVLIALLALLAVAVDLFIWPVGVLIAASALLARSWASRRGSKSMQAGAGAKFPYRVFMVSQYVVNGLLLVTASLP